MATFSKEDYQIGIVCALHIEAAAMTAMLDEEHPRLPTDPADTNEYRLGKVNGHNVIIACLPAGMMGTTSAATVASNMMRSFSIKVGLMVGIGGGVWSKHNDIRLGDIAVSQPTGKNGGVVQWDFGHTHEEEFERRGHLNSPPIVLLNALQTLKTRSETDGFGISEALQHMTERKPMMSKGRNRYTHPGPENDQIFEASYTHPANGDHDESTCEGCDHKRTIMRKEREDLHPEVFYGNIASGNSVMKSSKKRDAIAKKDEVICFEMEAAGLMNDFPCLVIRGIADYSDSHKNRNWQRYAAATAAAFARVFLGFVDKQKLIETPKRNPIIVPFGKNDKFVGRESRLKRLMDIFYTNHKGNNCQRAALDGLGGVGKTQIAIQFAFQLHERVPDCSVFWVRASDTTSFERSYRDIAKELSIPGWDDEKSDLKTLVKSRLSDKSAGKWLLIIDNADDRQLFQTTDTTLPSLSNYLPDSILGGLLFTTRDHKAATMLAADSVIQVGDMEYPEAIALLHSTVQDKQLVQDEPSSKELLKALCNLPLAISQAVAYINTQQITIGKYLELYKDKNIFKLLGHSFKDQRRYPDVQDPVATTWIISFEQIQIQDQLAAKYLKFIACIQDHDIPESILPPKHQLSGEIISGKLTAQNNSGERTSGVMASRNENSDEELLERTIALGTLKGYGFLKPQIDQTLYDMHPLVHLVTRNWMQEKKQFSFWDEIAVQRLHHLIPYVFDLDNKNAWFQFYPHAIFNTALPDTFAASQLRKIDLLDKVGKCQIQLGHYKTACRSHDEVLKLRLRFLGKEHRDTLVSMNEKGFTLLGEGKFSEAKKILLEALPLYTQVFGAEHGYTLKTMSNLAKAYSSQGKYKEAEELGSQVLEIRKRVLGPEHPDTLTGIGNLALTYNNQGKYKEAEELESQVLEIRKRVLGPEHPDTLTGIGNLALTYNNQGKYKEAEELGSQVLEIRKRVLGPEHPNTLKIISNLASAYNNQGKYKEAEELESQVLEISKRVLGPEHPDTLTGIGNLALTYNNQGKYKEAEELESQVLEISKRVLGPEHPDTLTGIGNLALTYNNQGKYKEAEELESQVLEIRKRVLGPEHPDTLTGIGNLALTYNNQGKYKEAEELESQVLEISKRVLGPEHPDTLTGISNLALTYNNQGKYKEAEELGSQVLEIRKRVLGPEHPDTLTSMNNLAHTWKSQGKYKEAGELEVQVLETKRRVLGKEHPDTLTSMNNLAHTWKSQGKYKEAGELVVQVLETKRRVLGKEHPETLISMNNLAHTWKSQGYMEKAIPLMEESFQLLEKTLGASHPHTMNSHRSLEIWLKESQIQPDIESEEHIQPEPSVPGDMEEEDRDDEQEMQEAAEENQSVPKKNRIRRGWRKIKTELRRRRE